MNMQLDFKIWCIKTNIQGTVHALFKHCFALVFSLGYLLCVVYERWEQQDTLH